MSIETFSKCRKSKVESKSCFFKHLKTVPRKTVKEPSKSTLKYVHQLAEFGAKIPENSRRDIAGGANMRRFFRETGVKLSC